MGDSEGSEQQSSGGLSEEAIADVLAGRRSYDTLPGPEQAVVREAWEERIAARIATLDLGAVFEATGQSWVELDDDGNIVEHTPRKAE
ncbi:MAG: hypothetical protein WC184_04360 [Acidimicrobiia bacterium]